MKPPTREPYHVRRSNYKNLPIYQTKKRGGNKLITEVKHIDGDIKALRDQLREALRISEDKECTINELTRHIIIKVGRERCTQCSLLAQWDRSVDGFRGI